MQRLSEIEIVSAVIRRQREGAITVRDRDRVLAAIEVDVAALLVELTAVVSARARTLLQKYVLRAGDAAQLASCLHLREEMGQPIRFVNFDERLSRAARAEGIVVE